MAAIEWIEKRGQKFADDEAREASDFHEILINFGLDQEQAFALFQKESLTVAKRLVLAETGSMDNISAMLFKDSDCRILEVIKSRLSEDRLNVTGNIIY